MLSFLLEIIVDAKSNVPSSCQHMYGELSAEIWLFCVLTCLQTRYVIDQNELSRCHWNASELFDLSRKWTHMVRSVYLHYDNDENDDENKQNNKNDTNNEW